MSTQPQLIWFNNKLVPWQEANIHVMTHTLHYGLGVFEGVRAYETAKGAAIFRGPEHTKRLMQSAHIMNMKMPYSEDELNQAMSAVMNANKLNAAYIRPLVFYGGGYMGLDLKQLEVHVMIAAWRWDKLHGENLAEQGLRVKTSSFVRNSIRSGFLRAKATGNYMNSLLAFQEAQACGFDEALFLDQEGYVCEGSGENIFIVRDNKIYTPETTYALDGITRNSVIQIARDLGYEVMEKRFTRDELYVADEAFFTGTAVEVIPIQEVDGRRIGQGKVGKVSQHLREKYFEITHGQDPVYVNWLTYTG